MTRARPGPRWTRRGAADALDELLELDARRRELLPEVESRRAAQNEASDEIAARKRAGRRRRRRDRAHEGRLRRAQDAAGRARRGRGAPRRLAATLPNFPHPSAPAGGEDDAVTLREVGERPSFDFEVRDHLDLGLEHGWIEVEKAAAASGSRFAYLLGDLVMVELALIRFVVETVRAQGFEPVVPPVLVREGPLYGTGFFPGEREMIYEVERDELFLVGTSEVSLAALHADEILDGAALPRRYAGISTCFRREAGAAGKDTRGIFRVHQFDKVEMFSFVVPDESAAEHERLLAVQESHPAVRSSSRTASWTSRSATWALPRRGSSTARPGSRARSATASSPPARTRPTTRRAAWAPGFARSPRRRRRSCTRSTGRRSPWGGP